MCNKNKSKPKGQRASTVNAVVLEAAFSTANKQYCRTAGKERNKTTKTAGSIKCFRCLQLKTKLKLENIAFKREEEKEEGEEKEREKRRERRRGREGRKRRERGRNDRLENAAESRIFWKEESCS